MPYLLTPFCRKCRANRSINGTRYCAGCQGEAYQYTRARLNAAKQDRLRNDPRERELHEFYKSRKWRRMRAWKLKHNPLCEDCENAGRVVPGREVDHTTRIKDGGDPFDMANLRTLCASCHARKRGKEGHATLDK